jgi:hypothetical protein
MADIKQLSEDEYNRMMHGSFGHAAITQAINQDALQVAPQPAQQPKTSLVQVNPVIPPAVKLPKANAAVPPPQPGEPDAAAVAAQVNQAREALRISTPPPAPPSAVDHLKDQVLENWKIPAIAAATYVGAKAIEYGGKKAIEKGKSVLENRRIAKEANANINRNVDIPFFEPPPPPPLFTPGAPESKLAVESQAKFGAPLADVEKHFNVKITNLKDAEILTNNYKNYMNSLSGAVSNQPAGIPTGTSAMSSLTNQRLSETPAAPVPKQITAAPINAAQTNQLTTGMRENYKRSKAEPIGPGAFNHLANNVGVEKAAEIWKDVYGEKNVPYTEYIAKYSKEAGKEMYGPIRPLPEGAKPGGSLGTPKYIPEYIKGGASIGGMAGAAAIPALVAAGVQAYKGNKEAVNAELKDAWNSMKSLVTMPIDVAKAAGKGDFGPFKDMLMSMNPGTLLMNEMNKRDEAALQGMIQAEKVGSGRGIAPPSAYKR